MTNQFSKFIEFDDRIEYDEFHFFVASFIPLIERVQQVSSTEPPANLFYNTSSKNLLVLPYRAGLCNTQKHVGLQNFEMNLNSFQRVEPKIETGNPKFEIQKMQKIARS